MSDAGPSYSPEVSPEPYQTQFKPGEDSDEELWDVIEIEAEKGRQYKVKWAGTDPKTGKPWPSSWVSKHDCTDDLIRAWKVKKAKKKQEAERRKSVGKPRASTASSLSKRGKSSASASTTAAPTTSASARSYATTAAPAVPTARKSVTTSPVSPARRRDPLSVSGSRGGSSRKPVSALSLSLSPSPPPPPPPRKRRKSRQDVSEDELDERKPGPSRLHKKRKLQIEVVVPRSEYQDRDGDHEVAARRGSSKSAVGAVIEDEEDDDVRVAASPRPRKSSVAVSKPRDFPPERPISSVPVTKIGPPRKTKDIRRVDAGSSSNASPEDAKRVSEGSNAFKTPMSHLKPGEVSSQIRRLLMREEEENTQEAEASVPSVPTRPREIRTLDLSVISSYKKHSIKPREQPGVAQPAPGASRVAPRPSRKSPNDTYSRLGIVPPTQSSAAPGLLDEPPYNPTQDDLSMVQMVPTTPVRSRPDGHVSASTSVVSKMKRRGESIGKPKPKPLKPMPYLDPEVFRPYLPSDDVEDIEQFSSPERTDDYRKKYPLTQDTIEDFPDDMMDYVNWEPDSRGQEQGPTLNGLDTPSHLRNPVQNTLTSEPSDRDLSRRNAPPSPEVHLQEYPSTSTTQRAEVDSQSQQPSPDLTVQIAELNAVLEEKDEKLTQLEDQIEHLQTHIGQLEQEHAQERSSLEAELNALRDASSEKLEQLSTLEDQMVEMHLQVTQLQSDNNMQREESDSLIKQLTGSLEERNEQVGQLEDALGELQHAIEAAQVENEALSAALQAQQEQIVSPQHDAQALQAAALEAELLGVREKLSEARTAAEARERSLQDTEADRVLLRTLYEEASAHAQRLARENAELEQRAARAEGQARHGVAMVRGTFEHQVKNLQAEVVRWRRAHEVLAAKDGNTNDEVRRRAAQEPELREENARLREEVQTAEKNVERMAALVAELTVKPKVGSKSGEDEEEEDEDADYAPSEDSGSSSSSDSGSGGSSSSAVSSESAGILNALDHPESQSPEMDLDVYICQYISGSKACYSEFFTERDAIDHARSCHYMDDLNMIT